MFFSILWFLWLWLDLQERRDRLFIGNWYFQFAI
jgi:hypothetical protein